jgi:pimeloyl-ACP methyl ester carboxylesterase
VTSPETIAEFEDMPHVEGVAHRFVEANGTRFHVAEAGDGDPVVLIHGWPQHWYEWRHLIPPLAERYRAIAIDLPGCGWSGLPANGYDVEATSANIVALLDALALDNTRLVGHDWGGFFGFRVCQQHPDRIRRYLALNTLPPFTPVTGRGVSQLWRFWYQWVLATPGLGPFVAGPGSSLGTRNPVMRWIGVRPKAFDKAELKAFLDRSRRPEATEATSRYYRTLVTRDTPRALRGEFAGRRLRTPTLLVIGTRDRVMREAFARELHRVCDDLRVELVPGVDHFIADEAPELVRKHALAFLAEYER